MKKIFLIITLLSVVLIGHSQNILDKVRKYDLERAESKAIKKARKLLKIPTAKPLFVFTYFEVFLPEPFSPENGMIEDFLKYLDLWGKDYCCYVYDDSLNILADSFGRTMFRYANTTPDNLYIEHINKLQPEYVFEYINAPKFRIFFCYKNDKVFIVYSEDKKNIISYPLSELDWSWLNLIK